MNEKEKFIAGLSKLGELTKTDLNDWTMEAYMSVFRDRWSDGIRALKIAFMKIRSNHAMPSAFDLLEFIGEAPPPAPTQRDKASEMSGAILNTIGKFGGYRAREARIFLGEAIWRVVENMGGWETLCMMEIDDMPTWRAQIRDAAEGISKIDYFAAQLSSSQSQEVIHLIENQTTGMKLN